MVGTSGKLLITRRTFATLFFTVPNSSCRKVMFFTSVCQEFWHGGWERCLSHCSAFWDTQPFRQIPRTHTPGQTNPQAPSWSDTPWSDTSPGQTPTLAGRHPLLHPPPVTATAADSTYPTGMYSCYFKLWSVLQANY